MAGAARIAVDFSVNSESLNTGLRKSQTYIEKFSRTVTNKLIGTSEVFNAMKSGVRAFADALEQSQRTGESFGTALTNSLNQAARAAGTFGTTFGIVQDLMNIQAQRSGWRSLGDIILGVTKEEAQFVANSEAVVRQLQQQADEIGRIAENRQRLRDIQIGPIDKALEEATIRLETLGMTADEVLVYKLGRTLALSPNTNFLDEAIEKLKELTGVLKMLEYQQEQNAKMDEFYRKGQERANRDAAEAKRIHEQNRTAAEEYADALNDLNRYLQDGRISEEDYNREKDRLLQNRNDRLMRERGPIHAFDSIQALNQLFTGRLGIGSFSAAKDPTETTAKNTEEISDKTDTTNALLRELVTAVNSNEDSGVGF